MDYLTDNQCTIKQILCLENNKFNLAIDNIKKDDENHHISLMLIKIRKIIRVEEIQGKNKYNNILQLI